MKLSQNSFIGHMGEKKKKKKKNFVFNWLQEKIAKFVSLSSGEKIMNFIDRPQENIKKKFQLVAEEKA